MSKYTITKLSQKGSASYLKVCMVISDMANIDWIYDPAAFVKEFAKRIRELGEQKALSIKHGYRAKVMKSNEVEIAHYRLDGTYLYPTHKVIFNK